MLHLNIFEEYSSVIKFYLTIIKVSIGEEVAIRKR